MKLLLTIKKWPLHYIDRHHTYMHSKFPRGLFLQLLLSLIKFFFLYKRSIIVLK